MPELFLVGETKQMAHESHTADRSLSQGIALRCPRCGANVDALTCVRCDFHMRVSSGIVHALPPERAAHYDRFVADYESIRAAEGRGSIDKDFYLSLPYADKTGRNSLQWRIRSKSYDYLIRNVLKPLHGHGAILDLGSGNCWMSYRLALQGFKPVAVDLLTNEHDGLGAASHYESCLETSILRFQAEAINLPFQNGQFDAVIFNASFHYAEDYQSTLREAFRCLKPGGMVIVSDTPWYSSEESGRQMVAERKAQFRRRFGTASDSVKSQEYLTDVRLKALEKLLSIRWMSYIPWYGWKWAMRPLIATLRRRREPSRFRIYVARKNA